MASGERCIAKLPSGRHPVGRLNSSIAGDGVVKRCLTQRGMSPPTIRDLEFIIRR